MRRVAGTIRYPHDRQHREPAVSKRDGIPAVGAGSWPVRSHQPAHAMSAHCDLARGGCASPSNPLPTVAPIRRSQQWIGSSPTTSVPPSLSHRAMAWPCPLGRILVVDAVRVGLDAAVWPQSPFAATSRQRREESPACPHKYVAQSSISRRGGRWPLRPNDAAADDSDDMVKHHAPRRRVRPHPLAGVGAFQQGYIRTGATPPTAGGGWYTWCTTPPLTVPRQRQKRGVAPVPSLSAGAVRGRRLITKTPNSDGENWKGCVLHPPHCFWYTPPSVCVPFCSTPAVTPIVTPERSSGQSSVSITWLQIIETGERRTQASRRPFTADVRPSARTPRRGTPTNRP